MAKVTPKKWRKSDPGCDSATGEHAFIPSEHGHVTRDGKTVIVRDTCKRCGVQRIATSEPGKRLTYSYKDVPHFKH